MGERHPSLFSPHKKAFALKRVDGEPLTRSDIQYDVLHYIFHDRHNVFTDPYTLDDDTAPKICFRDLYLRTILQSPKATKTLKDKLAESQTFAEDFAMLALLVNVGRVNTTMSFFAEMKTAIRTYHPIPSLQRTTGNLQDAPRIKHILKSASFVNDNSIMPSTPTEILSRARSGKIPSTTVTNLIFVFANHSTPIGHVHLSSDFDFVDIFLRENISSVSRARIFLWLCYHYLESPGTSKDGGHSYGDLINPFSDNGQGDKPPAVIPLSEDEAILENVDPCEEKLLAEKLIARRAEILKTQGSKEAMRQNKSSGTASEEETEQVGNMEEMRATNRRANAKSKVVAEPRRTVSSILHTSSSKEKAKEKPAFPDGKGDRDVPLELTHNESPQDHCWNRHRHQREPKPQHGTNILYTASIRRLSASPEPARSRSHHQSRYSPFPSMPRSMVQQAWHVITTTDPLQDSDEEGVDEHVRLDYIRRLKVINALYHKEPTPELEPSLTA